ncbi:MAG: LLM class F420-dependent oxidoreductase [Actinomycetota bacterium]
MTRIGYQIPNFTYPGVGPDRLFPVVAAQAAAADRSGFDTVLVMDHFYQLPFLGPPSNYMLECYTLLSSLAQHTQQVRLGALVTGNTYRNPALLAKTVTTLDVVSGGRAQLGIGAGWFEHEHQAFGYEFGTFTDRFERLEESLQIVLPMLRGERPTLSGKHYSATDVINEPPAVSRIPVMIGGSGETKTLRMVAQYADEGNLTCGLDEVPRKLDALAAHCERLGRDRATVTMSKQVQCVIGETYDAAFADAKAFLGTLGIDYDAADADTQAMYLSLVTLGGPDEIGVVLEQVKALGIDGVTLALPANGHHPENVELLGSVATRVFGPA